MENQSSRRQNLADGKRRSASASRAATTAMPEISPFKLNSGRKSVDNSNSTAKTRSNSSKSGEENRNPSFTMVRIPEIIKKPQSENQNLVVGNRVQKLQRQQSPDLVTMSRIPGIVKKLDEPENLVVSIPVRSLQRQPSPDVVKNNEKLKSKRPGSVSPSAWALSPGRSSAMFPTPDSPDFSGRTKKQSSKSVNNVLNYFRQKKMPSVQEESFHQFRMMHTRLLQWRYANALAESTSSAKKNLAEEKIFKVWLRIFHLRNSILEQRLQVQELKHELKIIQIINPQVSIIKEWEKIEKKNSEAVARIGRKLSASSTELPLTNGAKADTDSIRDAMLPAMGVMESIEATIMKFISQAMDTSSLASELVKTAEQERKALAELRKEIAVAASLEVEENSLKAHSIQAAKQKIVQDNNYLLSSTIKSADGWQEDVTDNLIIPQQRYRKGHFLRLYLSNVQQKQNS